MKKFESIDELNVYISEEFACENIEDLIKDYKRVLDILSKISYLTNEYWNDILTYTRG
jgi:hypothetical protein